MRRRAGGEEVRKLLERRIPLYALLVILVLQTTAVYGAVTVLYHNELAAFGTLKFTGEVEVTGFDIQDEQTVSVVLRRTTGTVEGATYIIGVACDNTMGSATVSWVAGDPDAKKILVQMGEPITSSVTVIKLRVERSG